MLNRLAFIFAVMFGFMVIGTIGNHYDSAPASKSSTSSPSTEWAKQLCIKGIRQRATYPSTLDIHTFLGYANGISSNGSLLVRQSFDAKNGFGLTLKYEAICQIKPNGEFTINIAERTY